MRINSSNTESVSRVYQAQTEPQAEGAQHRHHHGHQRAAEVSVSKPGQLLEKLRQLQETDAASFETLLGEFAQDLDDAASASGSQRLARLAERFAQAAESGELPSLGRWRGNRPDGDHRGPRVERMQRQGHHGDHMGPRQILRSFIEDALAQVDQALALAQAAEQAPSEDAGAEASDMEASGSMAEQSMASVELDTDPSSAADSSQASTPMEEAATPAPMEPHEMPMEPGEAGS